MATAKRGNTQASKNNGRSWIKKFCSLQREKNGKKNSKLEVTATTIKSLAKTSYNKTDSKTTASFPGGQGSGMFDQSADDFPF